MSTRSFMSRYDSESEDEATKLIQTALITPASNGAVSTTVANSNIVVVQADDGYVEFFRDSVPCPTCRGTGRIHKDDEKKLVAIIPLTDKRLKPRRTFVYITLTVMLCGMVGGLCLFFLIPRSVTVLSNSPFLIPVHRSIRVIPYHVINLTVVNCYNFTNYNYFTIHLDGLHVTTQLKRLTTVVGSGDNRTQYTVFPRSTFNYCSRIHIQFDSDYEYVTDWCMSPYRYEHDLAMVFKLVANYTVLAQHLQTTLNTFQYVYCGNDTHFSTKPSPHTTKGLQLDPLIL